MSKLLPDVKAKMVKVTLKKSTNGLTQKQKSSVRGLGLRKINHTVEVANTPENRGMMQAVLFLLQLDQV
jgi:large subunit ribosomal protein L30|tara:strand:+ start:4452 stop:4658 length:207 start_codon:yes stop_codon:yes gene_type:complete